MSQLLQILKIEWIKIPAISILFFMIGHCAKPVPPNIIDTHVEQKSEEKINKITDMEVEIVKPDGTKIKAKAKIVEDIFKSDYLKMDKHEEIRPELPRVFVGPAVATYLNKREYEFGLKAAYRFDYAIATVSVFPMQQRGEASVLIPTSSLPLPGWLK